jgi:hypothetical protein
MVVRAIGGWLLAGAMACGAFAQSPSELLRSDRPVDRAWGAYQAARLHDRSLRNPLLSALHEAEAWRDSRRDSEPYFAIQALFDALIQQGDAAPAEAILPFAGHWRDEVLLLLARGGATEEALLELREQKQNLAQWVAVNNLLFRMRSASFFAKTLREIGIGPIFEVRDTGEAAAYCGGGFGIGAWERKLPQGFPPIALYQLRVDFISSVQGAPLAIEGPTNVYLRRNVMEAGQSTEWEGGLEEIPGVYRERYLAALGHLSQEQMTQLLHPFLAIYWQSAEQLAREMARHMSEQANAIRDFVVSAQSAGLGSVAGMRLKIVPEVRDIRRLSHDPLPKAEPREIVLE